MPEPITAIDLFAGALIPGLIMVLLYIVLQIGLAIWAPKTCPALLDDSENDLIPAKSIFSVIVPPLILIFLVLGSILAGVATPTESAWGLGRVLASIRGKLSVSMLTFVARESVKITSMIFMILIGASLFSPYLEGLVMSL